jgi:hypothetical protein
VLREAATGPTGGFRASEEENSAEDWYKRREREKAEEEVVMEGLAPCPRCRHQNPTENRFCGRCGASLRSGSELAPRRQESNPTVAGRALLAELKPVGKALAVGLATLAARAGLMWLRRRAEGSGRPSLPASKEPGTAIPEPPILWSFEEMHVWLREGGFDSRIVAQRAVASFRATNPTDGSR